MSDCTQITNERWTLGELGYLDRPLSKRRRERMQKESEEQARHDAAYKIWHRQRFPERYDADGNKIKMW